MSENKIVKKTLYSRIFKRFIDIFVSFISILILSPIMLIIALLVWIFLGSPIVFTQKRPGKNEKIFKIYKFRTMSNKTDKDGKLLPDSMRLTKFGKILRATSLDELPQLFNILKGDMSLVGPRPLSVKYLPYYTDEEKIRHNVRPGLTGLAQIKGRNNLNWDDKLKYDIEYVKNLSFLLDIKIIILTFIKIFKTSDVVERGVGENIDFDAYRLNKNKNEKE